MAIVSEIVLSESFDSGNVDKLLRIVREIDSKLAALNLRISDGNLTIEDSPFYAQDKLVFRCKTA